MMAKSDRIKCLGDLFVLFVVHLLLLLSDRLQHFEDYVTVEDVNDVKKKGGLGGGGSGRRYNQLNREGLDLEGGSCGHILRQAVPVDYGV